MTRMSKAIYLNMKGEKIVWDYHIGKNQKNGRIFFLEINGEKFKKTADDQREANQIIDKMFVEFWDN